MGDTYKEISQWCDDKREPKFPKSCPVCGSKMVKRTHKGPFSTITYACGGGYDTKPQIQNHHDVWWGSCGKPDAAVDKESNGG
jgi:predicted RNA-binding Zn-ribbon protein involved in translation (DUF1610 family)